MRRTLLGIALVEVGILAWAAACNDSTSSMEPPPPRANGIPSLILSEPVPGAAASAIAMSRSRSADQAGDVVYVSLSPGTVPDGTIATIRNAASGQVIIATVAAGGLDPVPIPASVGDTLLVSVARTGGVAAMQGYEVVRASRVPVVVRTSPPAKRTDVALNTVMQVIFSTPIDSTTLDTGSVQLWRGTTRVAGMVGLTDATGIGATFRPDSLLAPWTTYEFVITSRIRSVTGTALASPDSVGFTTGGVVQTATQLVFTVPPSNAIVGAAITPAVQVSVEDAGGNVVSSATTSVTLALGTNPGGGTLSGTVTVAAVNGVASFSGLSIDLSNSGYTFYASANGLWGATSTSFSVYVPLTTVTSVSAGESHACAITVEGAAYCWGNDSSGQLGDGTTTARMTAVPVVGGLTFASVSAGHNHTCGVTTSGAAYCWGDNTYGELGNGTTTASHAPVAVTGGLTFDSVSAGYSHTCGVTTAGAAYCWGDNTNGELGNGTATLSEAPVAVSGGLHFASVSASAFSSCGIAAAGATYCWGDNGAGKLGDSTITESNVPVAVSGGINFATVSVGFSHACGVTIGGAAYCWGSDDTDALGYTGPENCPVDLLACSTTPVAVVGGYQFSSVVAGAWHSCGITTSGAAYCWGDIGPFYSGETPGLILGGLTFATISAGDLFTCAVTTAGAAYCWGANYSGALGNGTLRPSAVPVRVLK